MSNKTLALVLALPLFFCSPQTVPVSSPGTQTVATLPPAVTTAQAAPIDPLLSARADAAQKAFATAVVQYTSGQSSIEEVGAWSERVFSAQQGTLAGKALVDATRDRVTKLKSIEVAATQRTQSGAANNTEPAKATYFRASAEIDFVHLTSN